MLVMEKEDMFAHKLAALLERKNIASRDLFDIWYFMKNNWEPNRRILELRADIEFKEHLERYIRAVRKFDDCYILQGIGELLDERQKLWVKTNLKKEVLFLLNFYLENN